MKIFNELKTMELTKEQCDFTKGRLIQESMLIDGKKEYVWIYTLFTTKELYENEISDIKFWFETEYREMFEKCTRRINLGILMKDGQSPQNVLAELYAKAENNASRIHTLEALISSL